MATGESGADLPRPWLAHYPAGVPAHVDVPAQLVHDVVRQTVGQFPDRAALIYYGSRWSYRQLWDESGRLAAAFAADGISAGDRIALYLPNCPAYPIALLAAFRIGAIAVQVSPLYLGQDLARILRDSAPRALVTVEILYPHVAEVAARAPVARAYVARLREFFPVWQRPFVNLVLRRQKLSTRMPRGPGVRPWRDALRARGEPPSFSGDPSTTVAVFQYTGGTTGLAKAAMLSHRNLVANLRQTNAWNTTREPGHDIVLASIPFFHVYGLMVAMLCGLSEGSTIVIQTRPEIRPLLKLIDRYRPTQFPGVPALYQAFLKQPDLARYHLRSIKFCMSGSAPLPVEVQRQFEALTGAALVEGYGLSETSPVTHANPIVGERRAGSIGLPIPDTDQRLVDPADPERPPPPGEPGELAIRGPQVMLGYYQQPAETAAVLRDGWFLTGDIARIDDAGYAYIVDRKKDVMNVGGLKVYPREVEEVLFQHPAVADATVVGVPDAEVGEVPRAYVVRKAGTTVTAAELIDFVRARIAHFKAPRTVEFRESLPRSGVQKVLRRALREEAARPPTAPAP